MIPAVVGTLLGSLLLGKYFYGALLWLALTILEFLFFFGAAALSAMCGGTKLGAMAVYGVINLLVYLVSFVFTYLFQPLLSGVYVDFDAMMPLSPVAQLTASEFLNISYSYAEHTAEIQKFIPGDWVYAGVTALAGLGLLALAQVLYKKRHMESAGNTVSFKPVAPVLLVLYTLCIGVFLYMIAEEVGFLPWFMLLSGLAIGFFTGRMLLEKQIKVFYKKNWISFGILVLSLAVALGITKLDPLGVSRYVPKAENVVSVTMAPSSTFITYRDTNITLTEPEDIEKIIAFNKKIYKEGNSEEYITVFLQYKLKNGKKINREYKIAYTQENREFMHSFYSRWECLIGNIDKERLLNKLVFAEVYDWDDRFSQIWISEGLDQEVYDYKEENLLILPKVGNDEIVKQLIEAIYADCQNGTLSQMYNQTHSKGSITLQLYNFSEDREYIDITYYENCENILEVIEQLKLKTVQD